MMKVDKKLFFDVIRKEFGSLNQNQVDGFNLLLDEGLKRNLPVDQISYVLATAWHETAFTMQPIKEYGSTSYLKNKKYWPYIGRGYVQLTWLVNYKKASELYNSDFVNNPDLALDPQWACKIIYDGMIDGWFTDKDLEDYLDGVDEDDKEDLREFSNARRIVNGIDKQVQIGKYALVFEHALRESLMKGGDPVSPNVPKGQPEQKPKEEEKKDVATKNSPLWLEVILKLIYRWLSRRNS